MTASYQIVLDVEIHSFEDLRAAAKVEALKSMSAEEWESLRSENFSHVSADLHMIFDPGESPPGCTITNGEALFVDGDPTDE